MGERENPGWGNGVASGAPSIPILAFFLVFHVSRYSRAHSYDHFRTHGSFVAVWNALIFSVS